MDPLPFRRPGRARRLPRTRGDGPFRSSPRRRQTQASPHTRGWTPFGVHHSSGTWGFPAHAGMDPGLPPACHGRSGLPRTRGDGPFTLSTGLSALTASPHTRGWTLQQERLDGGEGGFPAHAGMDPNSSAAPTRTSRLPRTRGDGPFHHHHRRGSRMAPPHTRGWTPPHLYPRTPRRGSPAHAGMVGIPEEVEHGIRRKWNIDSGGSGTANPGSGTRNPEEVEHRFRRKWNSGSGGRERSSVA